MIMNIFSVKNQTSKLSLKTKNTKPKIRKLSRKNLAFVTGGKTTQNVRGKEGGNQLFDFGAGFALCACICALASAIYD
jgi:hypothetical protein